MAELLDELGYPREVTKNEVVSAFLQTIQRSLNCLSSDDQKQRRNALEKLQVCLLQDDGAGSLPPLDVLQAAWDEVILEKVLRCVSDPSEKCRELAIQLIAHVARSLTEVDFTLKEAVPVMEQRMGQVPVLETSEEIRLQLFSLLIDVLLPECELPTLHDLIDPLHRIVAATLFDEFHEVQKKACSVLVTMAQRDPEVFGNKTGVFLRGLVPCLNHAHSRVRIAVFEAIDAMMQCGLTKGLVAQQLAPGTKSLAFDHNAAVRQLFFTSVGNWLNFKCNEMSEDEIHKCVVGGKIPRFHLPELLPLLLLGITDEHIDIATLAYERLAGIGELYKRFMDHLDTRATHGPGGERFRSAEEDAKVMEQVMEEERKCEEKYQRELREAEQQRRLQSLENNRHEAGNNSTTSDDQSSLDTPTKDDPGEPQEGVSLYQSLKAQTSAMEKELNEKVQETEKKLRSVKLSRNNNNNKEDELQPEEDVEEEEEKEEERSGASGLHILTNEEESTKDTSEITDEGAVKKVMMEEGGGGGSSGGIETLQLPKPWSGRPNAGCRLMVEAFLRPTIEPAVKELKQWTTKTRLSAARFLHTVMILAEGLAKDNLDILIPAFFSAVGDDDVKVAKRIVATIHIIGFHVPPKKWLLTVIKPLSDPKTSQTQSANVLAVLAAFLYGTPRVVMQERHVVKICDKLYEKEVSCSNHSAVQSQILSVLTNLIQVSGALCKSSSFKIFVLLLRLQSVEGDADFQKRCGQVLNDLAGALGMKSARELYVQHIHSLIHIVSSEPPEAWSSGLAGKLVFQTFMRNAYDTVGPFLESLMPLFTECLQSDQDPTLRISFLQLLDELFEKAELACSWTSLAPHVLTKLLIPCAVWRASKTEAAVRSSAMVAIGTFLRRDLCTQEQMQEIIIVQRPKEDEEELVSVVKSCMDEEDFLDVRRASTHVIYQFLRIAGPILSDEERTDLIKILSKRMDDGSNLIRRAILPAVAMLFTTMPPTFSNSQVRDFLSFLVVHMDDEHPQIQEGVCRAMEACVLKRPEIVVEVLCNVRDHQRSPHYVDRVLNAVPQN